MKITREQIRQMIKEELHDVMNEKQQLDEGIGAMLAYAIVLFGGQVQKAEDGSYVKTSEETHQMVDVGGRQFNSPQELAKSMEGSGLVSSSDADRGVSNVQDSQMTDADAEYTGYDLDMSDGQALNYYYNSLASKQGDTTSDIMNKLSAEKNPMRVKSMVNKMTMEQAKELVSMDKFNSLDPVIKQAINSKAGLMNPAR